MKMVRIKENGDVSVMPFFKDINKLQEIVGGFIRPLYGVGKDRYAMLVDEDAIYKNSKMNSKASEIAGQEIFGCVILVKVNEGMTKFIGINENKAKEVANRIDKATFC